jgi:hypothetical protein
LLIFISIIADHPANSNVRLNSAYYWNLEVSITFDAATQHQQTGPATFCTGKKNAGAIRRFFLKAGNLLNLLDGFKHLESGLVRADKEPLEVFAQTLALQRVATGALFFSSHGDPLKVIANSESIEL